MSILRHPFLALGASGLSVAVVLVACGGDDPPAAQVQVPPPPVDASTANPASDVQLPGTKVYIGQAATLDAVAALGSGATDIRWEVLLAPAGSKVTTASVKDATGPAPTLTPDALGSYVLQVHGMKDGVPTAALFRVEALDGVVFWREATATADLPADGFGSADDGLTISTRVSGMFGASNDRVLDCPTTTAPEGGHPYAPGTFVSGHRQRIAGRDRRENLPVSSISTSSPRPTARNTACSCR